MAGFVIEVLTGRDAGDAQPLRLIDLADCERLGACQFATVRAGWARWPGSRQLIVREGPNRLLFIEGEPDRAPLAGETARDWLPGRTGSFRGFEIEDAGNEGSARVCVFVDPLGTRPVFFHARDGRALFADKLATIVANRSGLECDWPNLLEAAVLGSLYSPGTTILGAEQLLPGEIVEISGGRTTRRIGTTVPLGPAARPQPDAAARLRAALETAIRDTWTDPQGRLLLSGGLDSRLILGLAEGARKVMTIDWYPEETLITERVAAACGADLALLPFRAEDYCARMQYGYLVTGAAHHSPLVNNLGMASQWRRAGIAALTHGYFHNTIFRGWAAGRWERYPDLHTTLARLMGRKAHYFDRYNDFPLRLQRAIIALLSAEGREALRRQLAALAERVEPLVIDGFDLTFERLIMSQVARQIYFGNFLGWIEEIDVASPVFHHAVWDWYASTHPADRHRDRAVLQLYATLGRGLAEIPDFSTGRLPRPSDAEPAQRWRNQFWFPPARAVVRALRRLGPPPPPAVRPGRDWEQVYRQPAIAEALQAGIAALRDSPLFDWRAVTAALDDFLHGRAQNSGALWMLGKTGQWRNFVATPLGLGRQIRRIDVPRALD